MTIHFHNYTAAVAHLKAKGYRELKSRWWISADDAFRACIHPATGSHVAVSFIEAAR